MDSVLYVKQFLKRLCKVTYFILCRTTTGGAGESIGGSGGGGSPTIGLWKTSVEESEALKSHNPFRRNPNGSSKERQKKWKVNFTYCLVA